MGQNPRIPDAYFDGQTYELAAPSKGAHTFFGDARSDQDQLGRGIWFDCAIELLDAVAVFLDAGFAVCAVSQARFKVRYFEMLQVDGGAS